MKKIISLILILTLTTSLLCSCGEPTAKTEITFWHLMSGAGEDALQRQITAFNNGIGAQKGIEVHAVYIDWPGTASFATALEDSSMQSMPDIFQLYGNMVSYITDLDCVAWADDYLGKEYSSITKDDFIPSTLDAFTVNGKLLALPYAISSMMLFYNKTYLNQAGYEAPPTTLEELATMLPNIVNKSDASVGLHAKITDYELEHFLSSQGEYGTYITDNQNGRSGQVTDITCDKELLDFTNAWGKIIESGAVNFTTRSTTEEFAAGIDAMELMTSARIASCDSLIDDKFEWGVSPLPKVSSSDIGGSNVYGSGIVMFNHQDERRIEAAWTFMEYLTSAEAQTMLMEDMGYLPVNSDIQNYAPYNEAVAKQPQLGILFDVLNNAPKSSISVFFPNSSDIDNVITTNFEKYSLREQSSQETVNSIITETQKILTEYYRINPD